MNTERQKIVLSDILGRGNEVILETNWNSLVKNSKFIKITIDDKELIVDKDQLFTVLFMISDEDQQTKMVGKFFKQYSVRHENHLVAITTNKEIKKGETINVPVALTINMETGKVIIGKSRKYY